MLSDDLPFLCAFSNMLRRSSFVPCSGSTSWRLRVLGWLAWTVWRGPRTRPFTFNWLILSNFASMPGQKRKGRRAGNVDEWDLVRSKGQRPLPAGQTVEEEKVLNIYSTQEGVNNSPHTFCRPCQWAQLGHSNRHTDKSCGPAGLRVTWFVLHSFVLFRAAMSYNFLTDR